MAGEGEEEGLFDRCNGTPAFLAPEMMKPHTRYRWDWVALACLHHVHLTMPAADALASVPNDEAAHALQGGVGLLLLNTCSFGSPAPC